MKNVIILEDVLSIMKLKGGTEITKIISRSFVFLLVLFVLSSMFTPVFASNSPPTLSKGTVTPRKSYPNIDYTFTVTYTDSDNDAPTNVKVFIDGEEYDMEQVDPTDHNYTDGKAYSFKKVMSEGSYSVYYSADDGNGSVVSTNSFTLSVTWDVGHYDIIHFIEEDVFPGVMMLLAILFIIAAVLCLISILMVLQLKKIAKRLEDLGEGKEEDVEGEKEDVIEGDVGENQT